MDLPVNTFKAALREGRVPVGLWCSSDDTGVAEMLAGCGYDWLLFDCEHAALDPLRVLPLLQAVAPYPTHAMVRPSRLDEAEIKRLLDFGAQSILVPFVRTVAEAERAAASVAYAPEGVRGLAGITRATRYGAVQEYAERAREEICLIVQVETRDALDELEAIAAVPGVDAVFIGPADLAASMGYRGEPSHPDVRAACVDAVQRLRRVGMPVGTLSLDHDLLAAMQAEGLAFAAIDVDLAILRRGAMHRRTEWGA